LAIYRLSIQIIGRSKGRSAVAAAAYRAGDLILNERSGILCDYTRKRGIIHSEIMLPENAPPEFADRALLWNEVERIEKAKNSQLAREIQLALPIELSKEQNIYLAREYVKKHFVEHGMCADVSVHDDGKGNPHAHVLLTMRPLNDDKTWGDKQKKVYILDDNGNKIYDKNKKTYKCNKIQTTDWNEQSKAEEWRQAWSDMLNTALEKHGHSTRVDHRSYERQGIEQIPTIRMGVAATQMERRGIRTKQGDINRAIEVTNRELRQLRARIKKIKDWLYSVPITDAPTLIEMMNGVANGKNLETHWKRLADLKSRSKILVFLQNNSISNVEQLANKIEQMHKLQYDVSGRIKAIDRRKDKLVEHLTNVDNYKQYSPIYKKYKELTGNKQIAFREKYSKEIEQYESAHKYIGDHLNGYGKIPEKSWRTELDKLTAERYSLCEQYYKLKDEVKYVEHLRRNTENLMKENVQKHTRTKTNNLEM